MAESKNDAAESARFEHVIREHMFLLRHKLSSAKLNFLEYELKHNVRVQLAQLADGPVKAAFDGIREAANRKEQQLRETILASDHKFHAKIKQCVQEARLEEERHADLLRRAARFLGDPMEDQVAVDVNEQDDGPKLTRSQKLDSVKAQDLLIDLQKSLTEDAGEALIDAFDRVPKAKLTRVDEIKQEMERMGSIIGDFVQGKVKGAMNRVEVVAPDRQVTSSFIAVPYKPVKLEIERVSVAEAFDISVDVAKKVFSAWDPATGNIREPIETLVDQYAVDYRLLNQYATNLFVHYNDIENDRKFEELSDEALRRLQSEAMDAIRSEFEKMREPANVETMNNRLKKFGKRVNESVFVMFWGGWVEKCIERALTRVGSQRKAVDPADLIFDPRPRDLVEVNETEED